MPFDRSKAHRVKNGLSLEDLAFLGATGNDLQESAYADAGDLVVRNADGMAELFLRKSGRYVKVGDSRNIYSATIAPTATDDSSSGYSAGSWWIVPSASKAYLCVDATASAAVWIDMTAGGGGGTPVVQSKQITMRYLKTFATSSQMPNPFDANPLMTDSSGNDTSLNGGYQNTLGDARGAFISPAALNKISVSGFLRPYNVGAGSAPLGTAIPFTLHIVRTTSTGRTVLTTVAFPVTTLGALNQGAAQQPNVPSFFNFDAALATPIPVGSVIGISLTCPTSWAVIGDVALTINFRAE